jgi:hypothetical protein
MAFQGRRFPPGTTASGIMNHVPNESPSPNESRAEPANPATAIVGPCRRRRAWKYGLGLCVIAAACLLLWHASVLRWLAGGLLDRPPQADCTVLLMLDGDRRHDRAAAWRREAPSRRVLLIGHAPTRLVRLGVVRSPDEQDRRELLARGVPADAIEVLAGGAGTRWDEAERLGEWLRNHPDDRPLILCDRFESAYTRHIVASLLGPTDAARVQILGLPDRFYDETNWWKTRRGMKRLFFSYLALGYARWHGRDRIAVEPWNPEDYERWLRRIAEEDRP